MRTIQDCNVAVVGGAGFLGSHLVDYLIDDRGCKVLAIDNLEAGKLEFLHKEAEFVHHDITGSEDFLLKLFKQEAIRFAFNYAARPYIPDSFARPLRTCDVNLMGALKVINAAQEAGVQAILQISSAEIYGGPTLNDDTEINGGTTRKINEDDLIQPHSSYGVSKAAVDQMVQVRWRESGTPCIALRQFNCIGERETHPYIVPEIISQLNQAIRSSRKDDFPYPVLVRLGNNSLRDFLYAGDQAIMATELLEKGQFGEVYNLGSETGIKMFDLARLIGEVMGFSGVEVVRDEARVRPWEIWHLQSDNQKVHQVIEARPERSLRVALDKTVAWYQGNGNKWSWEK